MSIKTGVRELKKRKYKYLAGALLCLAAVNIQAPDTVWAGSWQQEGSSGWYQEDDGNRVADHGYRALLFR